MNEEKRLDERMLEDVSGGYTGGITGRQNGQLENVGEIMRRATPSCSNCARAGKDCPYHDSKTAIIDAFGSRLPTCYTR